MADYKLEESFGFLVGRSSRLFNTVLNRKFQQSGYNVTTEQWSILVQLWNRDGQTQQEIVEDSSKDKATITRLITGLERRNMVTRIPGKVDKRSKLVYLTPVGKKLQSELMKITSELLQEIQKGISEHNMEACKAVLKKVFLNLHY